MTFKVIPVRAFDRNRNMKEKEMFVVAQKRERTPEDKLRYAHSAGLKSYPECGRPYIHAALISSFHRRCWNCEQSIASREIAAETIEKAKQK